MKHYSPEHYYEKDENNTIELVDSICKDLSSVLIQYVRTDPYIVKARDKKTGRSRFEYNIGDPIGVLVALKFKGKILIGWSKRNDKVEMILPSNFGITKKLLMRGIESGLLKAPKGTIYKSVEPVVFSKKGAVKIAIERAIIDIVYISKEYKKARTSKAKAFNNVRIPREIVRELYNFIERTKKYYKVSKIYNIVTKDK